jgi:diaminopimelate epimerase
VTETTLPDCSIPFAKLTGAGNDFVVLEAARAPAESLLGAWVRRVCARAVGVGADGVVLVDEAAGQHATRLRFFNPDGLEHDFCGNGLRCAARWLALQRGQDPTDLFLVTAAGPVEARVEGRLVRTTLPDIETGPEPVETLAPGLEGRGFRQRAGVPHLVVLVDDPYLVDLARYGPVLRHDPRFAPDGVNVDLVSAAQGRQAVIRTWERGVEGETLGCGSGAVAAALVLAEVAGWTSPIELLTRSGEGLTVSLERLTGTRRRVSLSGQARTVYHGQLSVEACDYDPTSIRGRNAL